ncbi:hypothetical protein PVT67_00985 [Gallaecimonas kandeliae]|uniref:hypothetical protein n=1 Tax=Gallaecimonas kandeliae TaxID=3029055 RepID=UPI0026485E7D|nr:hypothetical protein [Gallaecimonas kandeliae]WKE65863.1 hypothetical protein PVT67_00985 [Gallaecimonas kandeliae]
MTLGYTLLSNFGLLAFTGFATLGWIFGVCGYANGQAGPTPQAQERVFQSGIFTLPLSALVGTALLWRDYGNEAPWLGYGWAALPLLWLALHLLAFWLAGLGRKA